MTYVNEVTTDAPSLWLRYENSAALGTNSGSATYTEAHAGATAVAQTGELGAGAVSFSTAAGTYQTATPSASELMYQTNASWSVEAWVKRSAVTGTQDIINRNVGNNPTYIYINNSSATSPSTANGVSVQRNNGSTNDYVYGTIPITADGKYHHVVITHDTTVGTGGTTTIYVDGVAGGSKANGSFTNTAASNTNPYYIGANSVTTTGAGNGLAMDEVAVYSKSLSAARVQAHYNAVANPTTGVTVSAPPFVMDPMATVAPSVAIAANAVAVPMGMGPITTVAPTSTVTRNITVAAPPMTLSAAAVAPALEIDTPALSVPPMTLSMNSGTAPVISTPSIYLVANDQNNNSGTATATTLSVGTGNQAFFETDAFTAPSGYNVTKATFNVYIASTATPWSVAYGLVTSAWTESSGSPATAGLDNAHALGHFTPVVGWNSIDITSTVAGWLNGTIANNGLAFYHSINDSVGSLYTLSSRESANKPYISVQYAPAVSVNASVPPLTIGQDFGSAPAVSTVSNLTVAAPAQTMALTFPGGIENNPDYYGSATPLTLSMSLPSSVRAFQETSITLAVPPVAGSSISLPSGVSVSTVTNVLVAAKPFNMSNLTMVGIYSELGDRYHNIIPTTIGADDVWYKLSEAQGATRAQDYALDSSGADRADGYFFGAPTFGAVGPELRKAVTFDGLKDYMVAGPYTTSGSGNYDSFQPIHQAGMDLTVEFSIRTTQLNGTVFNASGGGDSSLASISPSYYAVPRTLNGNKLVLSNGYLNVVLGNGRVVKAKTGFVADGKWHHIVFAVPRPNAANASAINTGGYYDGQKPSYLMVDGQPVLVRFDGGLNVGADGGYEWLPYAFMADADYVAGPANPTGTNTQRQGPTPARGKAVKNYLAGDLSEVVVRLNSWMPENTAQSVYYEWSDSTVVHPAPMTLSLALPGAKAKTDMKRMIAVYGLGLGYQENNGYPLDTYLSTLSGLVIQHLPWGGASANAGSVIRSSSSTQPPAYYFKPVAFRLNDEYMVYPVSITGDNTIGGGPVSADGMLSADASTNQIGQFVDDTTGLPRFINLQTDLAQDITDFDAVTVVNYPAAKVEDGAPYYTANPQSPPLMPTTDGHLYQRSMGLSDEEWDLARDALRDSILEAAYEGVSLWIGEWHMAQHLEFIGDVDIHSPGYELYGASSDSLGALLNLTPGVLEDERAQALDRQFLAPDAPSYTNWLYHGYRDPGVVGATLGSGGSYYPTGQLNAFRRITALVPGLTDLPAYDLTPQQIEGWSFDRWKPNGDFNAYNIQKRPSGYQIGDYSEMDVVFLNSESHGNYAPDFDSADNRLFPWGGHLRRSVVISARPEGVVGTIVAREMSGYYGPATVKGDGGTYIDNPYKDNAITIAAEVGSIVRGKAIKGRAFIELMETSLQPFYIPEDQDKKVWYGVDGTNPLGPGHQISFWDYDSRRRKEVKIEQNETALSIPRISERDGTSKGIAPPLAFVNIVTSYMVQYAMAYNFYRHVGMHFRGLHWLGLTPIVNLNDNTAYTSSLTGKINIPAPVVTTEKNNVTSVPPVNLWMETRNPANYRGNDSVEHSLPMLMELHMGGIGSKNSVPPMVLSLSASAPTVIGDVDRITVYLDNDTSVTLFIKEDN